MSGRISDFAVYEANPAIFYVGTAHGGVWKTTSNGARFTPLPQDRGLLSIGAVAVQQSNPDIVWVGTGESNNRQSTSWGEGLYKSTDGGKTFANVGTCTRFKTHRPDRDRSAKSSTSCSSRPPGPLMFREQER